MLELCRCPNIYGPDCIYIYIYIFFFFFLFVFFLLILHRDAEWWPPRYSGAKSLRQAENACFLHFSHLLKLIKKNPAAAYKLIDLS